MLPESDGCQLSFKLLVLSPTVEIIAGILSPMAHQGKGVEHLGMDGTKGEGKCQEENKVPEAMIHL